MEAKKSSKASLENKRGLFFKTGLSISLFLVFCAFEWTILPSKNLFTGTGGSIIYEDPIPITKSPEEVKKPKPKVVFEEIKIIENNEQGDTASSIFENDTTSFIPFKEITIDTTDVEEVMEEWKLDRKCEFIGGDEALMKWLKAELRYPREAVEMGIQGKVYVQFIINKKGEITDITLMKSTDDLLDKEALRVVSLMPNWKPGIIGNKVVSSIKILPINFVLGK